MSQHPITRAARRHQRWRVIAKRICIVRSWSWRLYDINDYLTQWGKPGRFAKWNLKCGCWMCKDEKYRDTRNAEKHKEKTSFLI